MVCQDYKFKFHFFICVWHLDKKKKVRYDSLSTQLGFLLLGFNVLGLEVGYNPFAGSSEVFGFCWAHSPPSKIQLHDCLVPLSTGRDFVSLLPMIVCLSGGRDCVSLLAMTMFLSISII